MGTVHSKDPVLGAEEAMVPQKGLRTQGWQGESRSREKPQEVLSQSWRVMVWKVGRGVQRRVKVVPGRRMSPWVGWRKGWVRGGAVIEVGSWAVERGRRLRRRRRVVRDMVVGCG